MTSSMGRWCGVVACAAIGGYFLAGILSDAYYAADFLLDVAVDRAAAWEVLVTSYGMDTPPHLPFTLSEEALFDVGAFTLPYWAIVSAWVAAAVMAGIGAWLLWPRQADRPSDEAG